MNPQYLCVQILPLLFSLPTHLLVPFTSTFVFAAKSIISTDVPSTSIAKASVDLISQPTLDSDVIDMDTTLPPHAVIYRSSPTFIAVWIYCH